jgi:adenine-specific methyltransferase EcoRI-like protein
VLDGLKERQQKLTEHTSKHNSGLQSARRGKKDEFYTQLEDIEREMRHHKTHFKGKTVLCNCDDPRVSNFFHYFAYNFEHLGLKRLITTCYKSRSSDLFSMNAAESAIYLEYLGDRNGNRVPDADEIGVQSLDGDGDFRSPECIELLKEADIVVTNPPFSLFREYVTQIIEYDKKFLIIGNVNSVTYLEVFNQIKNDKMWLGPSIRSGDREFGVPDDYPLDASGTRIDEQGRKFIRVKGVRWFTNLDFDERYEDLTLHRKYNEEDYPKYDNFDAIDVSKVKDIPADYDGLMGVPITFLDKYNPKQFKIIGSFNNGQHGAELGARKVTAFSKGKQLSWNGPVINQKPLFKRVVIQRKSSNED